jgi:hypothetical protein
VLVESDVAFSEPAVQLEILLDRQPTEGESSSARWLSNTCSYSSTRMVIVLDVGWLIKATRGMNSLQHLVVGRVQCHLSERKEGEGSRESLTDLIERATSLLL